MLNLIGYVLHTSPYRLTAVRLTNSMELWHNRILVLDFGSQYTQLIARRIREAHVYSQILPCTVPLATILAYRPQGIVLSGGPSSVYEKKAPTVPKELFDLGIPILGICYGMQLVTHLSGGEVAKSKHREYGRADLTIDDSSDLFKGIGRRRIDGRLDVAWGPYRTDAAGLSIHRPYRQFADCRDEARRSQAPDLLPAVPSGSGPYGGGDPDPSEFRLRHLWLQADLDDAVLCGYGGAADSRAGRQGAGDLRLERRSGLVGGGGLDASGDRRISSPVSSSTTGCFERERRNRSNRRLPNSSI